MILSFQILIWRRLPISDRKAVYAREIVLYSFVIQTTFSSCFRVERVQQSSFPSKACNWPHGPLISNEREPSLRRPFRLRAFDSIKFDCHVVYFNFSLLKLIGLCECS
jgi:hypothetical protein